MRTRDLRKLREDKKLTQEQASKILKITKEYLSMIERAERNPSDTLKEGMAELYNVSIAEIFLSIKQTKCLNKDKLQTKIKEEKRCII